MSTIRLTEAICAKAEPPPGERRLRLRDTEAVGLTLTVAASGHKGWSWVGKVHGRLREIGLGRWYAGSLAVVRKAVAEIRGDLARGENPADTRIAKKRAGRERANAPTWGTAAERWIESCQTGAGRKRIKKSWREDDRRLKLYFSGWTNLPLADALDARRVRRRLDEIVQRHGPCEFNQALALLRVIVRTARDRWDLLDPGMIDPTRGIAKHDIASRDRVLDDGEVARAIDCIEAEPDIRWRTLFTVLLACGTRVGETLSLRWADVVNLDGNQPEIRLQASTTKTSKLRVLPLPARAVEALRALAADPRHGRRADGLVFHSRTSATGHLIGARKRWLRILDRAGIKDARIHDLRRTAASWLVRHGESESLLARCSDTPASRRRGAHTPCSPHRRCGRPSTASVPDRTRPSLATARRSPSSSPRSGEPRPCANQPGIGLRRTGCSLRTLAGLRLTPPTGSSSRSYPPNAARGPIPLRRTTSRPGTPGRTRRTRSSSCGTFARAGGSC